MATVVPITNFVRQNVVKVVRTKQNNLRCGLKIIKSNMLDKNGNVVGDIRYKHSTDFSKVEYRVYKKGTNIPVSQKIVEIKREFFEGSKKIPKVFCVAITNEQIKTRKYNTTISQSVLEFVSRYTKKVLAQFGGTK